jgi:hypothetical protein
MKKGKTSFVPAKRIVECMDRLGFWYVIYALIVLMKVTNTECVLKSMHVFAFNQSWLDLKSWLPT